MHGRLVVGLCRGLLRNAHEAEDAAQQAFLSAHAAFMRGAEPTDPARWLTAIARNECLTRIRDRMRRPLPVADVGEAPSTADPVTEAARRADIGALWRAVGELAPQQREALLLREFGGLSYDELALALGVSVPAVESLLFRARARLRVQLRTAASALAGLLPRLLAGGAAKVAGATVAVGLLTSGVVVSEHALHHGRDHRSDTAAPRAFVNPLSDVPPARVPARTSRKRSASPRHRRASSPAVVPALFVPAARPPVVVTDPTPRVASTAPRSTTADNGNGSRAAVTTTVEETPSSSTEDGPGGTTTAPSDDGDSSGGGGGPGPDGGSDGGSGVDGGS